MLRRSRMYFRFPVVREVVQQEAGNDFSFADGRIGLLEKLSAESENALGLHCFSRSLDSPNSLEVAWESFRSDFPSVRRFVCLPCEGRPSSKKSNTLTICLHHLN